MTSRRLYYLDALWIALESLAMILLGSLAFDKANAKSLLLPLMVISGIDVLWIAFQWLGDLILKNWPFKKKWALTPSKLKRFRPETKFYKWLLLNAGVFITLGSLLACYWHQPLSNELLVEVTGINVVAFVIDIIFVNLFHA